MFPYTWWTYTRVDQFPVHCATQCLDLSHTTWTEKVFFNNLIEQIGQGCATSLSCLPPLVLTETCCTKSQLQNKYRLKAQINLTPTAEQERQAHTLMWDLPAHNERQCYYVLFFVFFLSFRPRQYEKSEHASKGNHKGSVVSLELLSNGNGLAIKGLTNHRATLDAKYF